MSKITLTNLVNLQNETTAVNAINNNNSILTSAMDNTLSRNGTTPNTMSANLDMNSNRILNLPIPVNQSEPLRLADVTFFTQVQNSVNLAAAVASATASAATATTQAGNASTSAIAAAASATLAQSVVTNYISVFNYIPAGQIAAIQARTSVFDCGPSINTALAAAGGQQVYFPSGTYPIITPIVYNVAGGPGLVPGAKIMGAGSSATIFQNQVAGTSLTNTFSTVNASTIVTMNWTAHGFTTLEPFTITDLGGATYGGLSMDGTWVVSSIPDANHITFLHSSTATSTVNNVGSCTITNPMLTIRTVSDSTFHLGSELRSFRIQGFGTPVGSSCIRLYKAFQTLVQDVWINGAVCDGIQVPCVKGDVDSTSQIQISNVRINDCGRWGLDLQASSGHNEISNITITDLLCDHCGFNQGSYRNGGGMKWKGQGIRLSQSGFTTAKNVGIYIPGGAGLASGFTYDMLVLENTTGSHFVVEGLDTMTGQLLEMYSNDSFIATVGINLDATNFVVKNINIQSGIVRATVLNNAYVAYNATGGGNLGTIRIYTPSFQVFGFPGQTQVAGFSFLP